MSLDLLLNMEPIKAANGVETQLVWAQLIPCTYRLVILFFRLLDDGSPAIPEP